MSEIKQVVVTQPQGPAPMQVAIGGNRNARDCPVGLDGKRGWSFGLFTCFSRCGLCCLSTWCPCIVYNKNKQRVHSLQVQGTPLPGGGETFDGYCIIYGWLAVLGYGWIMQIRPREEIRQRYGIRGGPFTDCLASQCCNPCALTQERREIELEENSLYGQ